MQRQTPQRPIAHSLFDQPYVAQLTPAQLLRAEGRTREAEVTGRVVHFKRLSPMCKVRPVWFWVWTITYVSAEEALEAARIWRDRVEMKPIGFMGGHS